jgi:hypothetical protein
MTVATFTPHTVFGLDPMRVSVALLVVTYAFIVAGRPDRTVVALIGASLVTSSARSTKAKQSRASTGTRSGFSPA